LCASDGVSFNPKLKLGENEKLGRMRS